MDIVDYRITITELKRICSMLEAELKELDTADTKSEYINDDYSYEEIKNIVNHGLAKDYFEVGDKLYVKRDEKNLYFDVVKVTEYGIVLLSHFLVAQMPFDAPEPENPNADIAEYGSNDYGKSSIRQWLNSDLIGGEWWSPTSRYDQPIACRDYMEGFQYGIDDKFLNAITPRDNDDKFFLLSEDEITNCLPNVEDRVKSYASGKKDWYWTRTPDSGDSYSVRDVTPSGTLSYYDAYDSQGVAPACVIGEIKREYVEVEE